jgi:hypothetical protein
MAQSSHKLLFRGDFVIKLEFHCHPVFTIDISGAMSQRVHKNVQKELVTIKKLHCHCVVTERGGK